MIRQWPERSKAAGPSPAGDTGAATAMQPAVMQTAAGLPDVVARPGDVVALAPNVLSVRHGERLLGGVLYAATPRIDWARLLRRSLDVDALQCPTCKGRLRVLAVITEREPVRRILAHLGLPPDAPPLARARDPTDDLSDAEPASQLGLGFA
jgi:hypothetical protein